MAVNQSVSQPRDGIFNKGQSFMVFLTVVMDPLHYYISCQKESGVVIACNYCDLGYLNRGNTQQLEKVCDFTTPHSAY